MPSARRPRPRPALRRRGKPPSRNLALEICAAVIGQAGREAPADRVLKEELRRREKLTPKLAREASQALFNYYMHALPDEISSNIGTSTLLAAWNAAVYVAQIDEERINEALRSNVFIEPTQRILQKHGGLWFQDESFVVTRKSKTNLDSLLANHLGH